MAPAPESPARITDEQIESLAELSPSPSVKAQADPSLTRVAGRLVLSLGGVLGLVCILTLLARKYLPAQAAQGRGGPIKVLSARQLGGRRSLLLVRVQDKTVLLGLTAQGIHHLSDIEFGRGGWDEAVAHASLDDVASVEKKRG